jgi:hypothetical protein
MAEMCTNTSLPPVAGAIKPKPLVVLNHFTVPLAIVDTPVYFATRSMRWPGLVSTRSSVWSRKKRQQVDIADIARPPCALFVRKASLSERHAPEAAGNRNWRKKGEYLERRKTLTVLCL